MLRTVRFWWNRFGPMFAAEIRKRRVHCRCYSQWRWRLDEAFVRINSETHYLWRAVDHEGEVLEVFATKRRGRRAALRFLKRVIKRYCRPRSVVTDRLRSYRAAAQVVGVVNRQMCGRWLNNRAENSHQPFRRRERAMARFRDIKTPSEIRCRACFDPKSFQPRAPPQSSRHFQTEPIGRLGRVAAAGRLKP